MLKKIFVFAYFFFVLFLISPVLATDTQDVVWNPYIDQTSLNVSDTSINSSVDNVFYSRSNNIDIPDPIIKNAVYKTLNLNDDDVLTQEKLNLLRGLNVRTSDITAVTSLEGLQYANNLSIIDFNSLDLSNVDWSVIDTRFAGVDANNIPKNKLKDFNLTMCSVSPSFFNILNGKTLGNLKLDGLSVDNEKLSNISFLSQPDGFSVR